ncbi:cysteine desulfurase family protein [Aureimonas altamirensis]|uniref:cysteine desulfurase family protein n=1 Tax=Aureimonas altamirensis TaxID=370622 RepID=UPI00301AB272
MPASTGRIYLDHNATSVVLPAARQAVLDAMDMPGNPSSIHTEGRAARSVLEKARDAVAALCGVSSDGVVFTSGATEAATTALSPLWLKDGREWRAEALCVLDTDHPCLRGGGRFDAGDVTRLPVDAEGIVRLDALSQWLGALAGRPAILAVSWANGESGVIQPLAEIRAALSGHDVLLVADAVQLAGRRPLALHEAGIDAAVVSAHKFGGPKGVGALVLADENTRPYALFTGGGQERGRRGGTESLPLIAGFGAAALNAGSMAGGGWPHVRALRDALEAALREMAPGISIMGAGADRLPNTIGFTHPAMRAETVQIAFDLQGVAVSAGSACSSGKVGASHVLKAMAEGGYPADPALGALRISLGPDTTRADIDQFINVARRVLARLGAAEDRSNAA